MLDMFCNECDQFLACIASQEADRDPLCYVDGIQPERAQAVVVYEPVETYLKPSLWSRVIVGVGLLAVAVTHFMPFLKSECPESWDGDYQPLRVVYTILGGK